MDGRTVSASNVLVPASTDLDALTPRERTVATWVAGGMLCREVAIELGISVATVNVHVAHAGAKLPGRGRPTLKIARYYTLLVYGASG